MNQLETVKALLVEEQASLASDGMKIARGIDHFNLTLADILEMSEKTELSPTSVIDTLVDFEEKGHDPAEAVEFLKNFGEEVAEQNKAELYETYMKGSNLGYLETFDEEIEKSKSQKYIKTGFIRLDGVLQGGLHEGLYVVGAIPSLGKTTWALQIADRVACHGTDVIIFSLEMSRSDLIARSISRATVYEYGALGRRQDGDVKSALGIKDGKRYANYTDRELKVIAFAKNEYSKLAERIHVVEGTGDVKVTDVRNRVAEHIEITGRVPLVVIDYLQLLTPTEPKLSEKQNMDKNVLELRRIARDFHCPMFVISSFNRSNYNTKVSFGSFKESGGIEYCADVIIGLQLEGVGSADFDVDAAKMKSPRRIEALVLKNRFGITGQTIPYLYFPGCNYFRETPLGAQESTVNRFL